MVQVMTIRVRPRLSGGTHHLPSRYRSALVVHTYTCNDQLHFHPYTRPTSFRHPVMVTQTLHRLERPAHLRWHAFAPSRQRIDHAPSHAPYQSTHGTPIPRSSSTTCPARFRVRRLLGSWPHRTSFRLHHHNSGDRVGILRDRIPLRFLGASMGSYSRDGASGPAKAACLARPR